MREQYAAAIQIVRSAWRYRWWALAGSWLVCAAGWAWVLIQPDVYEAKARVLVDSSSAIKRILGNRIVEPDFETKLNFVRQQMLGRVQLDEVARANDLHLAAATPEDYEGIVDRLRNRVRISAAGGDKNNPDNLYTITYQDEDIDTAVSVVSTLLNIFIEDSLGAEREGSESARQFLVEKMEEYSSRLATAEQRLAEFKRENAGRLPGTSGGYYQRLQAETEALESARKQLRLAESRRQQLEQQLRGEPVATGANSGGVLSAPPNSIDARILELEARLEQELLRFTEKHPDIIAMREQIEELRARKAREIEQLSAAGGDVTNSTRNASPIYQALRISLHEVEVEIASIRADISDRSRKVNELRSAMDEIPDVEAELTKLNRNYDIINSQYQMLVQSLETESLSTAAQQTDQLEFRVIDPPAADQNPVAPNRPRLLVTVLLAGLAVGGGIAFLLSQLNPIFSSVGDIRLVTGRPVLGAVSMAFKREYVVQRRRTVLLFFGGLLFHGNLH